MKKSTFLYVSCATTILLSIISCQALIDGVKESFTTVVARYIERQMGGIEIKDFEKDARLETAGLIDENGGIPKSFTFSKPDDFGIGGVMSCNELPLDFVKISNEAGARSVTPSKYAGTWEAIIPMPQGFRKIFLDLKDNQKCSIYFDLYPDNDVDVKIRKKTVLEGSTTPENGFVLSNVTHSEGYKESIKRFAGRLEKEDDSNHNVLFAKFKVAGRLNTVKMFELKSGTPTKGVYVGVGDFSEENIGKKITFEVDGRNFKLTIPEGTKLPKEFIR